MRLIPDVALQAKLKRWSRYLTALVILISGLVLIGWQFNIEILKRPIPRLVAMNPVTSFAFICSGISFFLFTSKVFTKTKQIVASFFASLVLLIAVLKITSLIFGIDFYVDRLLFYSKLDRDAMGNISNGMSINTSLCFLLSGIALLLMTKNTRKQKPSHFLAIIIFLIGALSLVGYLYRVQEFYGAFIYMPMALNSALCFLFFSLAVLFADPGNGIMKEITSTSTGSITARLLIPAAIILPVVLGLLRLYGDWAGVYTTEFGSAILVLAIIIIFLSVIWYNSVLLNRRDTLRMETENALLASENQMQTIFTAAPDAVIVIDQDSTIIKWNPKAEILFGWTANEVLGNPLHEIIIPHRYRESHKKGLKHFLRTGEGPVLNSTIEIQALNKNNREFDVALSISPTLVKDNYLFIGFIRDITEQKRAEEEIKASNKRFTTVFNVSPVAITITDAERKFMYVNDAFCDISGFKREDVIGRTATELNIVSPKEQEKRVKLVRPAGGNARGIEVKFRKAAGETIDVITSIEGIEIDNKACWVTAFVDITEQKKAEEKFKDLLESAPDATIIVNEKGKIVLVNHQTESLFGYKKEELINQPVEMLVPFDLRHTHVEHRAGYYKEPRVRSMGAGLELYAVRKNNTQFPVEISLSPLETSEGVLVSAAVRDITQRKLIDDKLKSFNKELTRQVDEKTKEITEIFERLTDGFIALDNNFCFTYLNKKAGELIHRDPASVIGKNVWLEFPDVVGSATYQALNKAMAEQQYVTDTDYYAPFDLWQENYIYPSPNGLSVFIRDITQRKKADQEINEARELADKLIDSLPGVFYFFDSTGKFIRWNRQLEEVTGYSAEEIAGMHPTDFFGEEEKQYIAERIEGVFLKGVNDAEANFITKTGKKIPYYFKAVLVNYEGEPCLLVNGIDITERKKLEEKQALFVSIVNSSDDAILSKTLDGIITSWNRGAEKAFGYSSKEIIGKHISILIPPHLQNEENEIMEKIRKGEGIDHYETERLKKNGKIINVSLTISPIKDSFGNIIGASKISRDITERKKVEEELKASEQKYKLLFESNPLPMWMMSLPDYDIIEANDSTLLQYGYTKEEFLQLDIFDLRPAEDIEKFKASMSHRFRGIYHGGIWRHRKKDSTVIYVDIVTHDMYYEGNPVRLVLANNVTEKYITQEKLKESYDSIRKLTDHLQNIREEERTHIAREIHDELGQQLTILKMDISWLNKKIDISNKPVKEKINELLSVVDATVKTVRRIASELRPSLIDDLGLVPAMEWHLEEFEKRSGIHKHFTAPETNLQLPDEMKIGLFRIFQESLTNVARHSKAKKVNVELKQDKKEVILTIADDGEGYSEKNAGERTLGILGMKERTLMLGGHYNINGVPGKGTTVSVVVPMPIPHNNDQ
jgi:PAS domain S-box-containing protein